MAYQTTLTEDHVRFFERSHIHFGLQRLTPRQTRRRLIGRKVSVGPDVVIEPWCSFAARPTDFYSLGAHSYSRSAFKGITIGRFCSIALDVRVMGSDHPLSRLTTSGFDYSRYPIYGGYLESRGLHVPRRPHGL